MFVEKLATLHYFNLRCNAYKVLQTWEFGHICHV